MEQNKASELKDISHKVREHIIRMSTDGGCFIGASLSCADILVYLYKEVLNIHPGNLEDPGRDYFFLSKGHDVPALYGTFAELGFIEKERLGNHLKTNDHIYWHPNMNVPGIEYFSGSLGHSLSVAIGVAIDCRMKGHGNRVFVVLGDGELNEGSIWEGALVAAAKKLDNLVAVVDRNKFQANIETEELIPLEPITNKFEAFGWKAVKADGHDFESLESAFARLPLEAGKPTVVIAETVRGKGLPSIEAQANRWFVNFSREEVEELLKELNGGRTTELKSEEIIAR